jgi:hypothetical protein
MRQTAKTVLTAAAITGFAAAMSASGAIAQERQHVFFKSLAENTKYTQQMMLDVGHMPGHQLRLFEIHRTYPNDPPVINGLKLVEQWTRGTSDSIDNNGSGMTYGTYVMENGDAFYVRSMAVTQSPGPGILAPMVTGIITGGTGKLAGMQGLVLTAGTAQPAAGVNQIQTDIEYWFGFPVAASR